MKNLVLYCSVVLLCVLSSCTTAKQMALIQGVTQEHVLPYYPDFVVGIGDEVRVSIQALNPEAALPFNTNGFSHIVDAAGAIQMPIIGKMIVAGKNTHQIQDMVAAALMDKLQNAYVTVFLPDASVVILGEVNTPNQVKISKPITIFEALGAAGGLTNNARCNQIEVIRMEAGTVNKYILDLTSKDVFESPCFYLTKGDVVNVLPLHAKLTK